MKTATCFLLFKKMFEARCGDSHLGYTVEFLASLNQGGRHCLNKQTNKIREERKKILWLSYFSLTLRTKIITSSMTWARLIHHLNVFFYCNLLLTVSVPSQIILWEKAIWQYPKNQVCSFLTMSYPLTDWSSFQRNTYISGNCKHIVKLWRF